MSNPSPTLSVIIPAYNVARYIRVAVTSALDQTYRDLEVIVVNDGSTDDTRLILDDLASDRRDPRLVLVHQDNAGVSAARNRGIRLARGRLIGFVDGDDVWQPAKAERHIAAMEADPAAAITFSNSLCIGEDGEPTGRRLETKAGELTLRDMIRGNQFGNGSTPVVRRECFDQAGLFRETLRSCEDYDMWCRILSLPGAKAVLVPELLTRYRIRQDSLMFSFDEFLSSADEVMRCLRAELPGLSRRLLREGHAEHYRIAAWKSATTGHRLNAGRYMAIALALCPWFPFIGPRAAGTLAAIILPKDGLSTIQWMINAARGKAPSISKGTPR